MSEKTEKKKGFFEKIFEKLDEKMEEKSKEKKSGCGFGEGCCK